MNILILVSSLSFGGAEKQAVIDANLLSSENNVYLVTFNVGPLKEQINSKVNYALLNKNGYLNTAKKLAEFCKKNNIDVIHSSLFAPSIISAISTFFYKTNLIWHFHSHEYDIPSKSKLAYVLFARLKTVKKIVFVYDGLLAFQKKRLWLPKNKLDILYNSSSFFENLSKKRKDDFSKIIIGYVGRIVHLKRVHLLIDLTEYLLKKEINNFEIWIIGDGDELKNLKDKISCKKLLNFFKFFGFQKNVQSFYEKFDLFILPSQEECLSIALIDALTMGIPSIAFDVGGNSQIIYNNINGFIVKEIEELFEKTELLINKPNLRKTFSENAIKLSRQKFSQLSRKESLIELSYNAIKK